MRHTLLVIISIAALCIAACSRQYDPRLIAAESAMTEHPDSALAMLNAIDRSSVTSDRDRALYALLMSQALDKNFIYVTDDSLISIAYDYYSSHDDKRRHMQSQYYLGRVSLNAADYPRSLLSMHNAHETATDINDKFWCAMTAKGCAAVYNATFKTTEALIYSHIEYDFFAALKLQPYLDQSMSELAQAHLYYGDYDRSIDLSRQLLDTLAIRPDKTLEYEAKKNIGQTLIEQDKYTEAVPYLEYICKTDMASSQDSSFLGLVYSRTGQLEKAQKISDAIEAHKDLHSYYLKYDVSKANGSLTDALTALKSYDSIASLNLNERIKTDLGTSVIGYYSYKNKLIENDIQLAKFRMIIILIIGVIVLTIIVYIALRYYRKQKRQISESMLIAENMKEILTLKEHECSAAQHSIRELINTKFDLFDNLFKAYYESQHSTSAKKHISNEVQRIIDTLSSDSSTALQLEQDIDEHCSGIMSHFRHDMPNLKVADYRLFLYSVLGFSTTAISLFLKVDKINSVYDRKKRLKIKIKQSESGRKDEYLQYLN